MIIVMWKRSEAGEGATDSMGEVPNREGNYVVEDPELGKNVIFYQGHSYGSSTCRANAGASDGG